MVAQAIHLHYSSAELSWVSAPVHTGHQPWCDAEELGRGGGCTTLAHFPFLAEPHAVIVFVLLMGTTWFFFLSSREVFCDTSGKFAPCVALKTSVPFAVVVN